MGEVAKRDGVLFQTARGPPGVRHFGHQKAGRVTPCGATTHTGLPRGCVASSLLGREDSELHESWGCGKGQAGLLLSEALGLLNGV